jgi:hypothetical protein
VAALFVAVYLTVWTIIDLPFFIVGKLVGVGPDKFWHQSR